MELTKLLSFLAVALPVAYGAPTQAANDLHPEVLEAMKRDLGLNTEQAHARVARDLQATKVIEQAQNAAGNSFSGAWIDADNVFVGLTDAAQADAVTAAGATPVVVNNDLSKLENAKKALDAKFLNKAKTANTPSAHSSGIAAYVVDAAANKLVIEALGDSKSHAQELASQAGLSASEYDVRTVDAMPILKATVIGGDAYYIDNRARCSVGFSVTTGFVSAGHCGSRGSSATTPQGGALGTFAGDVFPGSADMSYIRTVSGTTLVGQVDGYGGGNQRISGSQEASTGASICRSGSTTGVHCVSVQAKGATVNYAEGSVTGLTRTNVCAEPGDSGGSFYSGSQAQGVTSGGNGDCSSGGTTYFQPVNEILQTYGLTLLTS